MTTPSGAFTDEALNQLKLDISEKMNRYLTKDGRWQAPDLMALLHRLEASEAICKIVEKHGDGSLWNECEAWRKSKGE